MTAREEGGRELVRGSNAGPGQRQEKMKSEKILTILVVSLTIRAALVAHCDQVFV